ncbi:MAG: hypothetical protein GVY16_06900 [Planctomycetes bacterium]|nr:hypothetical protein [Phycisphaerae bacterium]NBB95454.1 hypothetical protein [Planctomycetota bacterium]
MASHPTQRKPNWLIALIATALAWLLPGAGHVYLGRRVRGAILFVTITATFWSGVAMGGVMTVDSRYESWWFLAQQMTGANGAVSWARQDRIYQELARDEDIQDMLRDRQATYQQGRHGELPPLEITPAPGGRPDKLRMLVDLELQQMRGGIALAHPTAGVARAYTGVAGLMNLLCIFDAMMLALMGVRGEPARDETDESDTDGADAGEGADA